MYHNLSNKKVHILIYSKNNQMQKVHFSPEYSQYYELCKLLRAGNQDININISIKQSYDVGNNNQ